jgi:nucleoside-diphosphate-sugar epimerase
VNSNDLILVTGGTGFIGGHIVDALVRRGLRVRVATSNLHKRERISRHPVELVCANLSDHESLVRAAAGCSVIFHAAYRFGVTPEDERRTNSDGTRVLAEAFLEGAGRRFIQLSSIEAYGQQPDGEITEDTPYRPGREEYGTTKQEIEQRLLDLHRRRGLPVSILQPTIVYGPHSSFFTIGPLEEMRISRVALPSKSGICNAVYVDDVVSAALLAADQVNAVGEKFIISGPSPTTWREFYRAYEKMLDKQGVIELDDIQMKHQEYRQSLTISRIHRALARRPELRSRVIRLPPQGWLLAAASRILPSSSQSALRREYERFWDFTVVPVPSRRTLYSASTYARIDKARRLLDYQPAFDLDRGMVRTEEWARSAGLLSL